MILFRKADETWHSPRTSSLRTNRTEPLCARIHMRVRQADTQEDFMEPNATDKHTGRRCHPKSRTGCFECKKRKVKCDETQPTCRKCAIRNRHCVYAATSSRSERISSHDAAETPLSLSAAVTERTISPTIAGSFSEISAQGNMQPGFTILHMHLLYHATTDMASYMAFEGGVNSLIACALDNASAAPFVLDQLLALAALHRSTKDRNTNSVFRHEATALQTRALSHFNEASANPHEDMGIAAFVFVSLLGIHILHDTLTGAPQAIGRFISDFVNYMRIHRGVRVVVNDNWTQIYDAELQPLLHVVDWIQRADSSRIGPETSRLRSVLETLPDGLTWSIEACLEALKCIQWVLNLKSTVPDSSNKRIHATMAWPLVVPEGYVESLHQRRPEAIAVLAFFAATLHQRPWFWGFADAGPQVIRLIVDHVGPFWADALTWPQDVIAQEAARASS